MLPAWAAGFWQSKLRYRTQEELLSVAREYKRRGLPLSVIVIDFFHWTKQGDWQFDPECWPDPAGMVRELEEMGVKVMVSIWPTVNALSRNFEEMQRRGLLIRTERGVPAHKDFVDTGQEGRVYVHFYDPTCPEARRFIWEQVREGYYQHGIKVWWLDACEPEIIPRDPENLRYAGNGLAVSNICPLAHAQAFYEGMRDEGEEEIITLCPLRKGPAAPTKCGRSGRRRMKSSRACSSCASGCGPTSWNRCRLPTRREPHPCARSSSTFRVTRRVGMWKTNSCSARISWSRRCCTRARAAARCTCPMARGGPTPGQTKGWTAASGSRRTRHWSGFLSICVRERSCLAAAFVLAERALE